MNPFRWMAPAILMTLMLAVPSVPAMAETHQPAEPVAEQAAKADVAPLWLNLTSAEPHRAVMALHLAEFALKDKQPVTVFLNLDAVKLAFPQEMAEVPGDARLKETPREVLQRLIANGAEVLVCPHCIQYAGLDPEKRLPGSAIAQPDALMSTLAKPNTRTLSY